MCEKVGAFLFVIHQRDILEERGEKFGFVFVF